MNNEVRKPWYEEVEDYKRKYGCCVINGYEVVLIQDPYIDVRLLNSKTQTGYYANAYCLKNNKYYEIFWEPDAGYDEISENQDIDDFVDWGDFKYKEI